MLVVIAASLAFLTLDRPELRAVLVVVAHEISAVRAYANYIDACGLRHVPQQSIAKHERQSRISSRYIQRPKGSN